MTSRDVYLVGFDLAAQGDGLFFYHHPFAQLTGHRLHIAHRQAQLSRNLFIGKVQAHEVQAQHPYSQRTVVPFEDRPTQIVKLLSASMVDVPLPVRIAVMVPSFFDLVRIAARAANPIRPAQLAYHLITLRIVDQLLDTDHARILPHRFLLHLLETN
jgi:hypothetical protein